MTRNLIGIVACAWALGGVATAQTPVAVPNPMAAHTLFIILLVGAFLLWAASFSLTTLKERSSQSDRKSLQAAREALLEELVETEQRRKSGVITQERFDKLHRSLRGKLAAVLAQLAAQTNKPKKNR